MSRFRELERVALDVLRVHGVEDYTLEQTKSTHYKLKWTYQGHPMIYVLPSTPSDRRGVENVAAGMRRMMRPYIPE